MKFKILNITKKASNSESEIDPNVVYYNDNMVKEWKKTNG